MESLAFVPTCQLSFLINPFKPCASTPLRNSPRHQRAQRRHNILITIPCAARTRPTVDDVSPSETDTLIATVQSLLASGENVASFIPPMIAHLADTRGMSRLSLVDAFGVIGPSAVPALLTSLATSPNPVIRRSSAKALAKIADPSATDLLIETLLNDKDMVTRSSAAGALARMGVTAVPKLLAVVSSDANMTAKGHASWAISFMQGAASEALFPRADDADPNVRLAVVSALCAVAIGNALPSMAGDIREEGWGPEELGAGEPGNDGRRGRALEVLSRALDDVSLEVRGEAATGLANAGVRDASPRIAALLKLEDLELRRTAALALMKLGYVESEPELRFYADDEAEPESFRAVARLVANALARSSDDDW